MSLIFSTATKLILPVLLIFSVFILVRGHNDIGGGFVGGLIAAIAFSLYTFALGIQKAKQIFPMEPVFLIKIGLMISLISVILPLFWGLPGGTGLWSDYELILIGPLSTIFTFDLGVYFVVLGVSVSIIFTLKSKI